MTIGAPVTLGRGASLAPSWPRSRPEDMKKARNSLKFLAKYKRPQWDSNTLPTLTFSGGLHDYSVFRVLLAFPETSKTREFGPHGAREVSGAVHR